ncbi:hypothetical protein AbraIFM66950_002688 [Aspergillus brasiliensis]|nr:hypothetical protein AbraIFM66950_002688 [Aspergillus brasiliensis]
MSSESSHTMEGTEQDESNEFIESNNAVESTEPSKLIQPIKLNRYCSRIENYESEDFEVGPNPEDESDDPDEQLFPAQKLYFRDQANKRYLCLIIIYGHSSHREACKEALRICWHRNRRKMSHKVMMGLIIDEDRQIWFRGSHTDERFIKEMGNNWVSNNDSMLKRYFRTFRRGLRLHSPRPGYDSEFEEGVESESSSVMQVFFEDPDATASHVLDYLACIHDVESDEMWMIMFLLVSSGIIMMNRLLRLLVPVTLLFLLSLIPVCLMAEQTVLCFG